MVKKTKVGNWIANKFNQIKYGNKPSYNLDVGDTSSGTASSNVIITGSSTGAGFKTETPTTPNNITPTSSGRRSGGGQSVYNASTGETYEVTDTGEKKPIKKMEEVGTMTFSGNSVKYGGREFIGNAVVPDTGGKTSNQFLFDLRQEYNKENKTSVGQGMLSGKSTVYNEYEMMIGGSPSNEKIVYGSQGEYTLNGNSYTSSGQLLYSGQASSPVDFSGVFPGFQKQIGENEKLTSIGIPFTKASISFKDIKEKEYLSKSTEFLFKNNPLGDIIPNKGLRSGFKNISGQSGKIFGNVVEEFIPINPKETAILGAMIGTGSVYTRLPTYLKVGISSSVALVGGSTALNKDLTTEQRIGGGIIGGLGALGVVGEGYNYLKEPITLKISKPNQEFKSASLLTSIRQGEKNINVGSFGIIGVNFPRFAFRTSRWDALSLKPYELDYGSMNFKELETLFPQGKIELYSKPSLTFAKTEPFLINKEGKISKPLRNEGVPIVGIDITKFTPFKKFNYVSKLEGENLPGEYNTFNLKGKMSLEEAEAFKQLKEITINERGTIGTANLFGREQKFQFGSIKTTDLFKVSSKGEIRPFALGKRTNRGLLVGTRDELLKIEYPNEFGLKELGIYKERIGFTDVTFPRVNNVKKGNLIKGISKERLYELPGEPEGVNFIQGSGKTSSPGFLKQLYEVPKQELQKQIVNTAQTLKNIKSSPIKNIKNNVNTKLVPFNMKQEIMKPSQINVDMGKSISKEMSMEQPKFISSFRDVSISINRDISKEMSRNVNREISRDISKEMTKEIQREEQKSVQKQIQKQVQKNVLKNELYSRNFFPTFTYGRTPKPFLLLPQLKFPQGGGIIRGERLFIETPSFGNVLGKEIGGISFKTSSLGGYSGLGERAYKTGIKLPTTILLKVQNKEFKL